MKYPCDECLVDVICTTICYDLIFFSDYIVSNSINPDWIKNRNRFDRLRICILMYGGRAARIDRIDNAIVKQWNAGGMFYE